MRIEELLGLIEAESMENGYQANIQMWMEWYKGNVPSFHKYTEFNGVDSVSRELRKMGMAKKVCEDYADFIYNPETSITVDESYQDRFDEILRFNNFESNINFGIEKGYALGTLGIVTSLINGEPSIQMASADMMFPIVKYKQFAWAIVTEYQPNVYYISVHYSKNKFGKYLVENYIININQNGDTEVLTKEQMLNDYNIIESKVYPEPMLHIIKPAIANNIDFTTPYGLSIYGNAISELQAVDIAFSAIPTELVVGKMLKFGMVTAATYDENGHAFINDEGYYVTGTDSTFQDGTTVKTHSPQLRTEAMIDVLETELNLLGRKCGMGDNAYSFENGNIYTNTAQVVSTNSKFYRTRQKHLAIVSEALENMVRAIYFLDKGFLYGGEVTVEFDDSIIHDKEQEDKELNFQLMNQLISEVYYWQEKLGLTEELAKEFVKKQNELKGLIEMPDDEGGGD